MAFEYSTTGTPASLAPSLIRVTVVLSVDARVYMIVAALAVIVALVPTSRVSTPGPILPVLSFTKTR